ncbi:uncharacterized protein [Engystomops pustulosus]|uniref:uncharacterized protein n=1 Tax=Engystomops pustulosus TaxID=76066 RepID=UPI003AFADCC7
MLEMQLEGATGCRSPAWMQRAGWEIAVSWKDASACPGLLQISPFKVEDQTWKDKWEELSNKCARGYMQLLIQMNEEMLTEVEVDIDVLQTNIQQKLSPDILDKFNQDLDTEYSKWEKEVCQTKSDKFQRDINDYQQGRVYKWTQTRGRNYFRSRSRSRSRSVAPKSANEEQQRLTTANTDRNLIPRTNALQGGHNTDTPSQAAGGKRKWNVRYQHEKKAKNQLQH